MRLPLAPLLLAALGACVANKSAAIVRVEPGPTTLAVRDATEILREMVDAHSTVFLDLGPVKNHRFAEGITKMGGLRKALDLAEVDPLWEGDAAFVATPKLSSCRTAILFRHHMTRERSEEALEHALANSDPPGVRVVGLGIPAVLVTIGNQRRVIAAPMHDHWVVLPEELAPRTVELVGARVGFGGGEGKTWVFRTDREGFSSSSFPSDMPEFEGAVAAIAIDGGGSHSTIDLADANGDPAEDARKMDRITGDAATMSVLDVDVKLFRPRWSAMGSEVHGAIDLGPLLKRIFFTIPFDKC